MEPSLQELEANIHREHWWFEGRRRILRRLLYPFFPDPDITAVEVGCGTGANADILSTYRRTVGIDISEFALRKPANIFDLKIKGDACALPLATASMDLVLALDILEHLDDDHAAVKEIRRVLRPDGVVLAFVPALEILWGAQDDLSHHKRRYRKDALRRLFADNGFSILRLSYFNIYFFLPILVVRKLLRWTRRPLRSENEYTPAWLNRLLTPIFASEAFFLERTDLPFGVSLMAVARPAKGPG